MKVLFIQLRFESNMAVMTLSSFLQHKGHETDIIIIEGERDFVTEVSEKIMPDIIAYSATTVDIKKLLSINKTLKASFEFFSIFGGSHPTFFPELIEEESSVDAICIGEGEYALCELADKLSDGKNIDNVENLYVRKNGKIIKNTLRPLILDLDSLPFLDKNIYSKYYNNPYLLQNVPIRFLSSRGCPYKCTYCFNHKFFELYGITGKKIRKRSVDSMINEIKEAKKTFDIPMVSFVDDLFCIPKEWINEFAEKYNKEVFLPYSINTRPNTITEEIASVLKKSGCYYITFSIESGDDYLRNEVLRRNMAEKDIIQAADILHKYKIHFCTGNILGIPVETLETMRKTIELNKRCAPHYAWASLFQPFPKVDLTTYAISNGFFDGDFEAIGEDQFTHSPLKLEQKDQIVRLHKFFALLVKYPYLYPLANFLINMPLNRLYTWMFRKYKIRFNHPVVTASKSLIDKQCRESIVSVACFLMKDALVDILSFLRKNYFFKENG